MMPAKPNTGPATSPQPNAGNEAAAMNKVQLALKTLEEALPQIPMGSDLHHEILKITTQLSKKLQPGTGSPGLQMQELLQMARGQAQSAPMQALARMQAPADAPPAMPGGGAPGGGPPMPMAA
jgi:hypothetical protein